MGLKGQRKEKAGKVPGTSREADFAEHLSIGVLLSSSVLLGPPGATMDPGNRTHYSASLCSLGSKTWRSTGLSPEACLMD